MIRSGCFSVPQKIHIQTNFFPLSTIDSSNLPIADQIRNEIDVFGFHPDIDADGKLQPFGHQSIQVFQGLPDRKNL